jgi:alpha-1,3-rhamnosyltransferase
MNAELPLVSVIIVSYAHEEFISQAINSVLDQSYGNIELIVIDNSDTQECFTVIQNHKRKSKFVAFKQENIGSIRTLNKFIPQMNGDYICYFSGDDFLPPDSIEKRVLFMQSHPEFPMCYGRVIQVDRTGNEIGRNNNSRFRSGFIFQDVIRNKYHPPAMTYFFRSNIFSEVGMYDENIFYTEDKYMLYKISSRYQIGFINEYLAFQRLHGNNLSYTVNIDKQFNENEYILSHYKQLKEFQSIMTWNYLSYLSYFSIYKPEQAYKYLGRALPLFYRKKFIKSIYRLFKSLLKNEN